MKKLILSLVVLLSAQIAGAQSTFTREKFQIHDSTTAIYRDGSGNMILKDRVAGAQTLNRLIGGMTNVVQGSGTPGNFAIWTTRGDRGEGLSNELSGSSSLHQTAQTLFFSAHNGSGAKLRFEDLDYGFYADIWLDAESNTLHIGPNLSVDGNFSAYGSSAYFANLFVGNITTNEIVNFASTQEQILVNGNGLVFKDRNYPQGVSLNDLYLSGGGGSGDTTFKAYITGSDVPNTDSIRINPTAPLTVSRVGAVYTFGVDTTTSVIGLANQRQVGLKQDFISPGTSAQYFRGDKSWADLTSTVRASFSGTTNRVLYTSGTGAFDISPNYVGQTSIVTLGNVTTGTWNGNIMSVAKGGTGGNSKDSALTNLLPAQGGNSGKALLTDGLRTYWSSVSVPPSSGTVTSIGLTMPAQFSVSTPNPITSAGTFTVTWGSQNANRPLMSPNGTSGVPNFRDIVWADLAAGGAQDEIKQYFRTNSLGVLGSAGQVALWNSADSLRYGPKILITTSSAETLATWYDVRNLIPAQAQQSDSSRTAYKSDTTKYAYRASQITGKTLIPFADTAYTGRTSKIYLEAGLLKTASDSVGEGLGAGNTFNDSIHVNGPVNAYYNSTFSFPGFRIRRMAGTQSGWQMSLLQSSTDLQLTDLAGTNILGFKTTGMVYTPTDTLQTLAGSRSYRLKSKVIGYFASGADSSAINTTEKYTMGYSTGAVIDTIIYVMSSGSSPSIVPDIRFGLDISASGTAVISSPSPVTSNTTATKISTFNNATVAAGLTIWLTVPTITTKPRSFMAIVLGHDL
jgi:hypothetical protein